MKLTYNPKNTTDTFVVEGTTDEIANLVRALSTTNNQLPNKVSKVDTTKNISKTYTTSEAFTHAASNLKNETAFLKSIYLYAPNPNTDGGRGAYVAKQILDVKIVNIAALIKKAKCNRDTIFKVVNRMRDAGADIHMTDTSITLVSLPDGPFQPKKYTRSNKKNTVVKTTILDKFSSIDAS